MVREETVTHLRPPQQHSGRMLGILFSLLNLMIMISKTNSDDMSALDLYAVAEHNEGQNKARCSCGYCLSWLIGTQQRGTV